MPRLSLLTRWSSCAFIVVKPRDGGAMPFTAETTVGHASTTAALRVGLRRQHDYRISAKNFRRIYADMPQYLAGIPKLC